MENHGVQQVNEPEFYVFINHIMSCKGCCALRDRYCEEGRKLWIAEKAAYICSLPTLQDRKVAMDITRSTTAEWTETIEQEVRLRFKEKKNGDSVPEKNSDRPAYPGRRR